MPLNEQSKQWLADKSKKAKGIKANSKEYKDGWDRIFGNKEKENKEEDKK